MHSSTSNKWRPIQAFIALTDNLEPNTGGFEACPGFHRIFDDWSQRRKPSVAATSSTSSTSNLPPCVGDFTPIRPKEDLEVIEQFVSIPCKAGDLVCWDVRIPHANSRNNLSNIAREAVYIGLLPAIPLNKAYALDQLRRYNEGVYPVDQWLGKSSDVQPICSFEFSDLGARLMGMKEWEENEDLKDS
eukprot:CAMPEP_0170057040 /NCGR_PEP_ID=MMETSP0019_2-20121128/205_1 /TAXON_ID=98059 /ORGANISM="Dinobryon sp., Strain UTEXLB2267" /LENGTH=187 /DNA_ID=CAMNT_0010261667 /DNA_START=486 /DNA_END=1049 /DNA_ORIENTATION=-